MTGEKFTFEIFTLSASNDSIAVVSFDSKLSPEIEISLLLKTKVPEKSGVCPCSEIPSILKFFVTSILARL